MLTVRRPSACQNPGLPHGEGAAGTGGAVPAPTSRRRPNEPLFKRFSVGKEWRVKDTGTS